MAAAVPPLRPRAPRREVVVLGGTGFVGRAVCRLLSSHGDWRVKVLTRSRAAARPIAALPDVVVEETDVLSAAALKAAIAGSHAVVNLVATLHGDATAFHRLHIELPQSVAHCCREAGIDDVVHVSALGVDDPGSSLYLQSKAWGEDRLRSACRTAAILRPSVIFGAEDRFINTFARLQRFAPIVPLACSTALFQPVWVEDVASAIVACLERPQRAGTIHECAGPDVLTLRELVARAGRWAGVQRPILPLPAPLGVVQAWVLEHLPGEPLMSRDNLRSMRRPNVATAGAPSLEDLGIVPRALDDYLARR